MHRSLSILAMAQAFALIGQVSVAQERSIRSFLLGRSLSCLGYLYPIRFDKNGAAMLFDEFGTIERVPLSRVAWTPNSVTVRLKDKGQLRLYVGTGTNPKLLMDVTDDTAVLPLKLDEEPTSSEPATSAQGLVCEIIK